MLFIEIDNRGFGSFIRAEGIRILKAEGSAVWASGGEARPKMERKSHLRHSLVSTEAPTIASARVGVVHKV
jgi:putative transposase